MVKEGDHLSMCVALDDLLATEGHCPFPSCQALLDNAEIRNGGKVCPECGRWALSTPPPTTKSVHQKLPLLDYEYIEPHDLREDLDNTEDVEIYRQIYVQARAITKENIKSGIDAEQRGRGSVPSENTRTIRIVSPPREKPEEKPIKGILRRPRDKFPEDPAPIREGVAPLKDGKKDIPPDARWTKISRKLVNPAALEAGKERFEARDDFVIVLRVLSREEIQAYADVTQRIRATKGSSDKKPATRANVGDRDERQPRSSRHRHKQERQHRQYPERQYRSTIDDANSIRLALEQKQSRLSVPVRLPDYMRDSRASTTSATRHDSTGYRADEDTDYDGIQYTNPSDLVRDDLERTAEHSNHPLRARRSEVSIRTKIVTETGRDSKI
ncbi:uncharacterized protein LY89DRAFT_505055 [Mollisia scopiformis]|uniref:DUF8035 domain-containing protein n=1 Tax=Mollisia scopiformis TaxID=149040 RepID=A0A194XF73_MOLSC|nr:uncharacterized protein LY89DRAFT_505055 [Mollisia scopiformis]KUJ18784.1 hypothetical protein LY89DRAFT_505055 [Mollisia scopiformis]